MKILRAWLIAIFILVPFILTFLLSIFSFYRYPQLLPSRFTIMYWENLFKYNPLFLNSIKISISIGSVSALFSTIIGFMAGRTLVSLNIVKKPMTTLLYSLPLFVPSTALFIGVHMMMIKVQLANTFIGVVLAHVILSLPYAVNISISFFLGIPTNLENVAKTLGCSKWLILRKVIIPLIYPGLLFSFAVCFLLSISDYFASFLIGGGRIITLSGLLYPYIQNADYGNGAVLSITFIFINLIVFFVTDFITHKLSKVENYLFN